MSWYVDGSHTQSSIALCQQMQRHWLRSIAPAFRYDPILPGAIKLPWVPWLVAISFNPHCQYNNLHLQVSFISLAEQNRQLQMPGNHMTTDLHLLIEPHLTMHTSIVFQLLLLFNKIYQSIENKYPCDAIYLEMIWDFMLNSSTNRNRVYLLDHIMWPALSLSSIRWTAGKHPGPSSHYWYRIHPPQLIPFADDSKLIKSIANYNDLFLLQDYLGAIPSWIQRIFTV